MKITKMQLQGIIAESTKKALNELDWKTYANAARKRAKRDKRGGGRNEKVRQLDKAASDALNKKFNMQNHRAQIYTDYDDYSGYGQTGRYPSLGDVADYTDTFYSDFKNPDRDINRISYPSERSQEMSDYFKGNYDYTPDKGWHLKESQLRNIIKENIKKVLNEENEETFESIVFKKAFDIRAFVRSIQHAMSGLEQCARQMDAKEGATAHYLTQVVNDVRFSLEQIENNAIELKNARADVIRQQK
jgi:hypothetical protein